VEIKTNLTFHDFLTKERNVLRQLIFGVKVLGGLEVGAHVK
jgi:hypothetical protein